MYVMSWILKLRSCERVIRVKRYIVFEHLTAKKTFFFPDCPFRNFKASGLGKRRFLFSSGLSCDLF